MQLTAREFWGLIHGMVLGGLFLLAFSGGLAGLYSLRPEFVTVQGLRERIRRLNIGTWVMAVVAWLTVITGTYIVYPWYRAKPPEGADLRLYPRAFLLSSESTKLFHEFGMEWKEHIAWFAPILATAVAYIVWKYGDRLAERELIRKTALTLFVLAFLAAAVAGLLGALITKKAPIL
ncbi:hypothetical protein HRbin22_00211 [Candidatus Thermoflexus japonica]|uniref:Uncharacterized protein n=1 Tax=Candidatus Thermoflexus japonica TaxID=2035417 RepID=A0A2H5Y3G6_9CHLR|nr:hypothetical protein HRbin22_00211 [Candidatus Thermoflexus japonica]